MSSRKDFVREFWQYYYATSMMKRKKILLAFDSFKGCLSSVQVARAASRAILGVDPDCQIISVSVADGGEGTVDAVTNSLGGRIVRAKVSDPLGRPIEASFGIAGEFAIIESAAVCGLALLSDDERNPLITTSRGLGELMLAAWQMGCSKFIIGLGGSATNDGGQGMMEVPGLLDRMRGLDITVACDVDNPFIGPRGASRIFGPQKGASPQDVEILEKRLTDYAGQILKLTGVDVRNLAGAGAAGGLGGAFKAFFGAKLKRGVDMVLDAVGFDSLLEGVDLIITGEGCSDAQTLMGKCASGVLERAGSIPVVLLSGQINDADSLLDAGFSKLLAATPPGMELSEAIKPDVAARNIEICLSKHLF